MIFALKTVMVEASSGKISLVFSFESGVIMGIVSMVMIMSAPRGVGVIGMSRIMPFIETYTDVDLGIS